MAIGDWGTAGQLETHFGGTPMYASSHAFKLSHIKDVFAFGRIAIELFLDEFGNKSRNGSNESLVIYFSLVVAHVFASRRQCITAKSTCEIVTISESNSKVHYKHRS